MSKPNVSVCICTYRRPEQLDETLRSLSQLVPESPTFEVVVVDNDSSGSAESCVQNSRSYGLAVRYIAEPVKNIARARNLAIREARAELVAFIDDDEVADSQWLASLHKVLTAHASDAVFGPVLHKFVAPPPRWIEALNFFDYPVTDTGTELPRHLLRTGNVLLRKGSLRKLTHAFDEDLGLSGGEDTDLFSRLRATGAKLVSAKNAIVHETVPPQRMTFRWLALRHFRWGIGRMTASRRSRESVIFRVGYLLEAIISFGIRLVSGLVWAPFSRGRSAKSFLKCAYWTGVCAGFVGFRYYEYQ